jgi:hypothetical protein
MIRRSLGPAAAGSAAVLVLALAAPASGPRIEVPVSTSILQGMAETTETLRVGVLTAPPHASPRDAGDREEARLLLAEAFDVVGTGAVPEAARVNLRACRPVDRVIARLRRAGPTQALADLEFWASCLVDNYVGRISLAGAHLQIAGQGEDPCAPEWARDSVRVFPLLTRAAREFFPPEGVERRPSAVRAFRRLVRASRIAGRSCDWVVVPDPPPPAE